jgi:hypothetical protein
MKKYICVMLVIVAIAFAGTITKTFQYSESNLIFNRSDNYVIPTIPGQLTTREVGSPCLPMATYQVLVPASANVTSITIEKSDKVDLPGVYNVMPVTEPQPLSLSHTPIYQPNNEVYNMTTAYPGKLVDFSATGSKSGYRICGFSIYPVQYIPSEGKLTLYKNITVKINYEENTVQPISLTNMQKDIFEREIRTMVINPEDIPLFAPQERRPPDQTNYLLITTDAFVSYFQPLVDWRTKQGFNGEILTVNTISSTYPGRDVPEKIRNAIIYYFQNRGLIFVVLGGDGDIAYVPKRGVHAYCNPYTETSMPCDLYFSDLTGSWDGDHDSTFGEVPSDSIDFYPDVYVGRASVSNTTQATTFVNKVLTFEKNPPTDYLKRMLLPSVMLFSSYSWHGHFANDSIAAITPAGWTDRSILDPTTPTPMRDSLNNGFEFCCVNCHGNEVGFYTASSQLIYGTATASSQANGNKLFILNSIACHSGAFDYSSDCLAEAMMNNPNGGAVATIQNSRYGWGMPPYLGPSEWMDVKFYDFLFNKDSFYIGIAHARSKSMYTAQGLSDDCWRWCIYELNLFGDPAMAMWQDVPQNITAQYPQVVPLGPSNVVVNVSRAGTPVNHALVSIQKGTEVYEQGYTNMLGSATISITPTSAGHINLTITAQDCYPFEDSAVVQANGPYVNYLRATLVDSVSDHCDSIPNPGEEINMQTWVKNWGNQLASNVSAKLSSTDPCVTISDSMKSFGNIPANDSAFTGLNGFKFTIAPSCTNGQILPLRLSCRDALDSVWNSSIYIRVGTPVFHFRDRTVYDPAPGNNNGRIDPGETADLIVTLANTGYGNGYDVYGVLRSSDAQLQVMDSVGNFGLIEHDTTGFNPTDRFTVRASSSSSPGTTVTCSLKVYAEGVYMNTVGFNLIIGEFRPIDPIPDGPRTPARYWAYDNIDTLYAERPVYNWVEIKNIGTRLSYNQNDQVRNVPLANFGTLKFFGQNYNSISISVDGWIACGNDTNHAYSNMPLPSSSAQPAMICANWDDLYHSNSGIGGVYWYYNSANGTLIVEWDSLYYYAATTTRDKFEVIFYDSTYTTPTGDNIFLVQYMTANLTNSSTIGIQDETRAIGLQYLYNGTYHPAAGGLIAGRAIKYTTASPITGIADDYTVNSIKKVVLYQNRPNPFTNHTLINYNVTKLGKVSIGIYDATGRLIKTLVNGTQNIGSYTLQWNGRDEKNNQVAQGIYFCRLKTDNSNSIRKMTLVK